MRAHDGDAEPLLREFAAAADAEADGHKGAQWSYRRDLGGVRLLVIDSRCGRMLDSGDRSMVSEAEFAWIEEQVAGDYDHLLIGTSLPWLLPRALHDLESWDERARRPAPRGRRARRASPRSCAAPPTWSTGRRSGPPSTASPTCSRRSDAATTPARTAGRRPRSACCPATCTTPTPRRPHYREPLASKVYQLTCSPLHNYVPGFMKVTFRISWSRLTERSVRFLLGRVSKVPPMTLEWERLCGPYFGDQIATLTMDGRVGPGAVRAGRRRPAGGRQPHDRGRPAPDLSRLTAAGRAGLRGG